MRDDFVAYRLLCSAVILGPKCRHEICLLTSKPLIYIGHVNNIIEDRSMHLDNAFVLGNLCEYRHKLYIAKN